MVSAAGQNVKGFILERSMDASAFTMLAEIDVNQSQAERSYLFNDKFPYPANSYYRLKL